MNKNLVLFICALFFISGCSPQVQKATRFMLGSYCTIQVPGGKGELKKIHAAMDRMQEIDKKMSSQLKGSIVNDFNEKNIPISDPEIIALTQRSIEMAKMTEGAFDVTMWGVSKLWNFSGDGEPRLPADAEIREKLKHCGYEKIYIKEGTLYKKDPLLQLDFGGIAQGYGVAEALKVLKSLGVKNALIDVSGDIYALGKLNKKEWRIAIERPRGKGMLGVLEMTDMAVVTSGDYERFFEKDGRRYHHILDPKTGYPSQGMQSITVVSSDPVFCDAMSTALFVMGPDKALEFCEKTADLDAIIVDFEGKIKVTSYFKDVL